MHSSKIRISQATHRSRRASARRWQGCMLLALLSLAGCSNEALYQAIQENRLQACEQIPIAQQAACKAQYQTDYDTYKRERDLAKRES